MRPSTDYGWLSFLFFYTSGFPKTHVTCVINCLKKEKKVLLGKSESWRWTGVATGAQRRGAGRWRDLNARLRVQVGTAPSGRLKQTKNRSGGLEGPLRRLSSNERWSFRKDGAHRVWLNGLDLAVWIKWPVWCAGWQYKRASEGHCHMVDTSIILKWFFFFF